MNKVLYADAAGTAIQKVYGKSHIALAALIPASLVSPSDSIPAKIADVGIAAVVPFHAHVGLSVGEYKAGIICMVCRYGFDAVHLSRKIFLMCCSRPTRH
jgi:hypothetical protein